MCTQGGFVLIDKKQLKEFLIIIGIIAITLTKASVAESAGSKVDVAKEKGKWVLKVNGKDLDLKGVGCGQAFDPEGLSYLGMAKEAGATTVRTWGVDQISKEYLDEAQKQGLYVNVGAWFSWCNPPGRGVDASYVSDNAEFVQKREREKALIIECVKKFKDHPAVLMWTLGNETIYFSNSREEKIAFCKLIADIARQIKTIDPHHPVSYICAGGWQLRDSLDLLKEHAPEIDIIGVNQFCPYAGMDFIQTLWNEKKMDKPYYMGEFGPIGPWTAPTDIFGQPIDDTDVEKAKHYDMYLYQLSLKREMDCLGGYAYLLGNGTQDTLTWWNINYKKLKREAFYRIKYYYTGEAPKNFPPHCTQLYMDKRIVKPKEKITAYIDGADRDKDLLTYDFFIASSKVGNEAYSINQKVDVKVLEKGKTCIFEAPEKPGIYRFHALVSDPHDNCATQNITFKVE
jgi:hypothetical protein